MAPSWVSSSLYEQSAPRVLFLQQWSCELSQGNSPGCKYAGLTSVSNTFPSVCIFFNILVDISPLLSTLFPASVGFQHSDSPDF